MKPKFVIGLGASAGGLEALERFFDNAPTNSGGAFVVVMHLSRDFKSMLDELLSRHTKMPVKPIIGGAELEADTVYVIQPATTVEIDGARFKVSRKDSVAGPATTIDTLLSSLATSWRERAAGVILSGSGSDGAHGVTAILNAGGFACAQAPETAKFDTMPLAAINTDAIRAVEAPEQLAQTVIDGVLLPNLSEPMPIQSDHDIALAEILRAVMGVSHLDAAQYKHSTFERRIRRRMLDLNIGSIKGYAKRVQDDPVEAVKLSESLLIGVTEFFRDPKAFNIIDRQIIPEIIRRAQEENRPARVWVPGCATGQEAYTLAILFADAMADSPLKTEVQVFATDISRDHLATAARGEFEAEAMETIPNDLKERYFKPAGGRTTWTIDPEIRKMIVFASHDVMHDPPFTRQDLISCRNLLIYFSIEAQQKVLGNFSFGLLERGFLFLGSSETIGGHREAFEFIDAKHRVFRRTDSKATRAQLQMRSEPHHSDPTQLQSRRATKLRQVTLQPAYSALLKEYAPPCLLLSPERELLHSFGDARAYLRPPEGVAHLDAADMVDASLKTPLIAGVERVLRDNRPITFSKIMLDEFPAKGSAVDLTLRPIAAEGERKVTNVLAIIDDTRFVASNNPAVAVNLNPDGLAKERIEELEAELERTREALQSTIEEMETTNEELQSANEELMSANEELQSTNEELSSVNEELYSVNAEFHRQNDELTRLSGDFDLLLESTEIGVVFFDPDLKITRFTSLVRDLFGLAESDIGRRISNFRSPFKGVDPEALLSSALNENVIVEEEAVAGDGDPWLMRAIAHPGGLGVVMSLVNLQRLRESESMERETARMLSSMQSATRSFYLEHDADIPHKILTQVGFAEIIGVPPQSGPFELDLDKVHPHDHEAVRAPFKHIKETGAGECTARIWDSRANDFLYYRLVCRRLPDGTYQTTGTDVDELVRGRDKLAEHDAMLSGLINVDDGAKCYVKADRKLAYANEDFASRFGLAPEDLTDRLLNEILPNSVANTIMPRVEAALEGVPQTYITDAADEDGAPVKLYDIYQPVADPGGAITGFFFVSHDVTALAPRLEAIARSDELVAHAARQTSVPILIAEPDTGRLEFANEPAKARMGLRPDQEAAGVFLSRLTPEWSDQRWLSLIADMPPGSETRAPDVMVFDDHGRTTSADLLVACIEVRGRRRSVVRLMDVGDRAAVMQDLKRRSAELAVSNRDLEQFASVVAHDLRAPLRHISQFSDFLKEDEADRLSEEGQEYLKIITDGVSTMSGMVEGLLEYARVGRNKREFTEFDLNDCMTVATDLLSQPMLEQNATVDVGELPKILGDRDLIIRLFQNLIENAIKYARPETPPRVDISATQEENAIRITVSDNGVGVPAEFSDKVFLLFQRLQNDDDSSGLGLGLATCRRICELHGGAIEIDSGYTDGARFIITWPMDRVAPENRQTA